MRYLLFLPVCLLFAVSAFAPAYAVETVKSPSAKAGEVSVEYKGKYEHDTAAARNGREEMNLGLGYGFTNFWKTKVEGTLDQPAGANGFTYTDLDWENVVRVATQKDIGVDFALHQSFTFASDANEPDAYMFGVIARHAMKNGLGHTLNLRASRDMGANAANGTSFIYRWQTLLDRNAYLKPGFEVYGDTRKKDAFRDQSLKVGPVLKGGFKLAEHHTLGYEMGYNFGVTPATPDGTVRWKLEYLIALN